MAVKNWYLTNTTANSWRTVDEATQGAATNADGCVIGSSGTLNWTLGFRPGTEVSGWADSTQPDGSLDTTNFDALRTTNAYTGNFASANWTFNLVGRPVSSATSQQFAAVIRLFRSANANGTGATEITSAQQTGTSSAAMTSTTTDYTSTVTFNPGAFSVNNEYIFFQLAYKRIALGSMTTADCDLRTGSSSTVGTRIASADFTATITGDASVTEAADTTTGAGVLSSPVGTASVTEVADTTTGAGAALAQGTSSVTEIADTTTADGAATATGESSVTEIADTITADGAVTASGVTGDANVTEAADTTTADGAQGAIVGTSALTETADTTSAAATSPVVGTAGITESADTVSGAAVAPVVGTSSVSEVADTTTAAGVLSAPVGTANITESADTTTADGTVSTGPSISGDLNATEAADTSTLDGVALVAGTGTILEAGDTLTALGVVDIVGAAAALLEAMDTLLADGTVSSPAVEIIGDADILEAADTLDAQGGEASFVFVGDSVYVLLPDEINLYLRTHEEPVVILTKPDELFVRPTRSLP